MGTDSFLKYMTKLMTALAQGGNQIFMISSDDLKDLATAIAEEIMKKAMIENQQKEAGLPAKEFLTANEVCNIVGVSMPTLWRWANAGYLVPIMVGAGKCKIRKFRTIDIKRILQQR